MYKKVKLTKIYELFMKIGQCKLYYTYILHIQCKFKIVTNTLSI